MGTFIDLTGRRFTRWTVLYRDANRGKKTYWAARCDCGSLASVLGSNLADGKTQSCGCLRSEVTTDRNGSHGEARSRLFRIHGNMKQRCENPNNPAFKYYGQRGVTVCDAWHYYEGFRDWAVINGYADDLTIDRINGSGNYEPSNCRWVSQRTQVRNRAVCLSGSTVDKIKGMLNDGSTTTEIGQATGVDLKRIRRIRNRETWVD